MIRTSFPKQKVPLSKKRNLEEWGKPTVDAVIDSIIFPSTGNDIARFYDAYNGVIREEEYQYVLDPYKSESPKLRKFPARLRNYNIIKPVIDVLLGEKDRRGISYHVTVKNGDVITKKEQAERQAILENIKQHYINEMNAAGLPTGKASVEDLPDPEQMIKEFKVSYKDARAISGEEVLEFLKADKELHDEFLLGFFDWLITGRIVTFKDVQHDDVHFEIINPLEFGYEDSPSLRFIEDAAFAARKTEMTTNEIVDAWYDELTPEDIDDLEDGGYGVGLEFGGFASSLLKNGKTQSDQLHDVYHAVWKTFTEIGILTYPDPVTGEIQELEVPGNYRPDPELGESIEKFWVNEVWEGYRIGDSGSGKYLGIGPIKGQRGTLDNPSKCKLPYNGRNYSDRNAENISIVGTGIPYQLLYNIFHYRLELSMAKNKDKIMLMEMNTIPKRHGWDEESFLYYMDALGVAFIDSTAEGKTGERVTFNQWQVMDMSLGRYMEAQMNLLETIKYEWEETLGINRQRKGQINTSDGKGTTEAALAQSTAITNEIFRKFEMVQQRDLQGILDLSKIAYSNGKKAAYLNSEFTEAYLDIDPLEYCNSEFGVFVTNSAQELTKIDTLKQLSLAFAQNQGKPSTIAEILDSSNFQKTKAKLKELEAIEAEQAQQAQQAEQQAQERLEQMRLEDREDRQLHEAIENQKDRDHEYLLKTMELDSAMYQNDSRLAADSEKAGMPVDNSDKMEKIALDREKHYNELREKQAERLSKQAIEMSKLAVKNKEIDTNLKIAKENKNRYDAPKRKGNTK